MMFGPALGGYIASAKEDLVLGPTIATLGSLASCAAVLLLLPDARAAPEAGKKQEGFSLSASLGVAAEPRVLMLLLIKTAGSLAMAVWHSQLALQMKDDFKLDPAGIGMLMSYNAVVGMSMQGLQVVRIATTSLSERSVNLLVGAVLSLCFVLFPMCAATANVEAVLDLPFSVQMRWSTLTLGVLMVPMTAAMTVYRVCGTAQLTNAVDTATAGTVIGLDMGIGSLVRMLGPPAATPPAAPARSAAAAAGPAADLPPPAPVMSLCWQQYFTTGPLQGSHGLGVLASALMGCMAVLSWLAFAAPGKKKDA